MMGAEPMERTLRELIFPSNLSMKLVGITLPTTTTNWELKHSFIKILPKFSGMPKEDPLRHLQDFEMICGTILAEGNLGEYIRLVAFPFSLHDGTRDWLYTLPTESVTTWLQMQQKFMAKYFPVAQVQNMRKGIININMGTGESFYDYWWRFKQMLAKCPQHQLPDHDVIQYFVAGLRAYERCMVHAACGGSILNKRPSEAFKLLAEMAENFRDDGEDIPKQASAVPSSTETKIDKLCSTLEQLVTSMGTMMNNVTHACELCLASTHVTDQCPNTGHRHYGPNTQGYNHQWARRPQYQQQYQQPQRDQDGGKSLADLVHSMAQENAKARQENERFKKETRCAVNYINAQLSHLTKAVARLEEKQGELPPQVEVKHQAQVYAVTLRSEKSLPKKVEMPKLETVMTMMADSESHPAHDDKPDTPTESTSEEEDEEEDDELKVKMPKPATIMPKTSEIQVVQNESDLVSMRFQTNWRICMDYQNFTWEPGGQAKNRQRQDVEEDGHDAHDTAAQYKERIKRVHDQLREVKIFRLQRAHDQAIRLKKFEHGQKLLLYDPDDLD